MGRPERSIDPNAGPVERLAWELRQLREQADRPSYRTLADRAHYSRSTLADAATGLRLPTLEATLAYATACGAAPAEWEERWRRAEAELAASGRRCPYPGLAPLGTDDGDLFFGRAELVSDLLDAIRGKPLAAVVGASGSGKSSLLLAGLVPALTAEGVPVSVMTPGAHPRDALAETLSALADHGVLVIDQFEETFTVCATETERAAFLDAVTGLVPETPETGGPAVVLGIRADFYGHCAAHPGLVTVLRENAHMPIGPMTETELREIITGPAARVGQRVEPELVATVLVEAAGQPGGLPLVAHALRETWRREDGEILRLAGYQATGGVREAVAQTAEALYSDLDQESRTIARSIFLRLTALGEGTDDTRRRVDRDELTGIGEPGEVDTVLDRLAAARLVVADHDAVEVAHEALIRAWPRLRDWLTTDREDLLLHRRLTDAAAEWDRNGGADEYAYRGSRLAAWNGRSLDALNELETAFLTASRARQQREESAARRRVRLGFGGLGVTAAVVSVLAVLAMIQAGKATAGQDRAYSRQLAASARRMLAADQELALLLATKAYERKPTKEAETTLRQATLDSRLRRTVPTGQNRVQRAAFSPDGRKLALMGGRAIRTLSWDGENVSRRQPERVRDSKATRGPADLAFGPSGRLLAVGHRDGLIEVWDEAGATPAKSLRAPSGVEHIAFSADGKTVASLHEGTGSHKKEIRIWDLSGARKAVAFRPGDANVQDLAISPDGTRLATVGISDPLRLWDITRKRPRPTLKGEGAGGYEVTYSPDGQWAATNNRETVKVWDVSAGQALLTKQSSATLTGHEGLVSDVEFSSDGRLMTYGDQGTIRIWTAGTGVGPLVLRFPKTRLPAAGFGPGGRTVTTVGDDGTLRFWDVASGGASHTSDLLSTTGGAAAAPWTQGRSFGNAANSAPGILSADAEAWVATPSESAERSYAALRLWNLKRGGPPAIIRGMRAENNGRPALAVSPCGRKVAAGEEQNNQGIIRLQEPGSKGKPVVLRGSTSVNGLAFSPDGRWLASTSFADLRVWPADGRAKPSAILNDQAGEGTKQGYAAGVAFSPDGRLLGAARWDGKITLWAHAAGEKPWILPGHAGGASDVAFSPDGRTLASTGTDRTVRLWSTTGRTEPLAALRGFEGEVNDMAFSPGGEWLATAHKDGNVRLWRTDAATEPVVVSGFGESVERIRFSSDGKRLAVVLGYNTTRIWECDVCVQRDRMLEIARKRATRKLTSEERRTYLTSPQDGS